MSEATQDKKIVVKAIGLTKVFRDFWNRPKAKAVNDIDFEVREGEVVGLLGPNGSGKSTTVKMILGLLYPNAGQLTVLGKSPRAVDAKREIGYLPEDSYLYKYLTADETLDFFGSLFNLSRTERKLRIEQLLDMVGLAHARNRRVGEFSKGMARRIGLAQAMINDPALLILDEPTSGLDPLGCREVKDLILMLKKRGKTVIVTSHLLSDVEDVCDRVVILYGGKIRAQGTLSELLEVSDANRIVTPALPAAAMTRLLELLRASLHGEEFTIDHPRRSLEDFFLDVINRAKQDSVETAGVVGGGRIANYLQEGATDENRVLENLVKPDLPIIAAEKKREEEALRRAEEESEKQRLDQALDGLDKNEVPEKKPDDKAEVRENVAEADEKLNNLLNDK
ncbi:MAG: ABC transporter ATP-binding protein [Victivallaceae bacterium]|nr:ABC transporter ATP-binding protein [Victivallaceae bacterium]